MSRSLQAYLSQMRSMTSCRATLMCSWVAKNPQSTRPTSPSQRWRLRITHEPWSLTCSFMRLSVLVTYYATHRTTRSGPEL